MNQTTTTKLSSRAERRKKSEEWIVNQVRELVEDFKTSLERGVPVEMAIENSRTQVGLLEKREPGRKDQIRIVKAATIAKICVKIGLTSFPTNLQEKVLDRTLLDAPPAARDPEKEAWRYRKDIHSDDVAREKLKKPSSGQDAKIDKNWSLGGRGVESLKRLRI